MRRSKRRPSVTGCFRPTHVLLLLLCVLSTFLQEVHVQPDPATPDPPVRDLTSTSPSEVTSLIDPPENNTVTTTGEAREPQVTNRQPDEVTEISDEMRKLLIRRCQFESCAGRCLQKCPQPACSCLPQCVVYGNCCPDVEQECPELSLEAPVFPPRLLEATVECAADIGKFVISGCPRGSELTSQHSLEMSSVSSAFQPYVFDTSTGLLYKNTDIYNCYATNVSDPKVWEIVVEEETSLDADSIEDLLEYLENAKWFYKPISPSYGGVLCQSDDGSRSFRFSVTVNFNYEENKIEVVPNNDKRQGWKTLACGLDSDRQCVHEECADSKGPNSFGKCVIRSELLVRGVQPPWVLSNTTVRQIAEALICGLQDLPEIYDIKLLVVNATYYHYSDRRHRYYILSAVEQSSLLHVQKTLNYVKSILAYFYIELGIAYGANDLYFVVPPNTHGKLSAKLTDNSGEAEEILTEETTLGTDFPSSTPELSTHNNTAIGDRTTTHKNEIYPVFVSTYLGIFSTGVRIYDLPLQRSSDVFPQCLPEVKLEIMSGRSAMRCSIVILLALIVVGVM